MDKKAKSVRRSERVRSHEGFASTRLLEAAETEENIEVSNQADISTDRVKSVKDGSVQGEMERKASCSGARTESKDYSSRVSSKNRNKLADIREQQTYLDIEMEKINLEIKKLEIAKQNRLLELREIRLRKELGSLGDSDKELDSVRSENDSSIGSYRRTAQWVNEVEIESPGYVAALQGQLHDDAYINKNKISLNNLNYNGMANHNVNINNFKLKAMEPLTEAQALARKSIGRELPQFSGDPMEWPNFYSQLMRSSEACRFSQEENVLRLQKSLKGKAKEAVRGLLALPNCFNEILQTLSMRFGQPQFIIKRLIEIVKNVPNLKDDKLDCLFDFATSVQNLVITLKSFGRSDHLANPQLLEDVVNKLSTRMKLQWGEYLLDNNESELANIEILNFWLQKKARALSLVSCPVFETEPGCYSNIRKKPVFLASELAEEDKEKIEIKEFKCIYCEGKHLVFTCKKFESLSVDNRWKWATEKKNVCFSCLRPGHRSPQCRKKKPCDLCNGRHQTLLHRVKKPKDNIEKCNHAMGNFHVLLRVVPVCLEGPKGRLETYALLDEGSTVTLCEGSLAKELGCQGQPKNLEIMWLNGAATQSKESEEISFKISGCYKGAKSFILKNVCTLETLSLPEQSVDLALLKKKWPQFQDLNLSGCAGGRPRLIIGQDNWPLLVPREVREGPWEGPVATKTRLGWTLHGRIGKAPVQWSKERVGNTWQITDNYENLEKLIKLSFDVDESPIDPSKLVSEENRRAMSIMEATTKRIGERWETGLLWKSTNSVLPDSKNAALSRLYSIERKLDADPSFAQQYCSKISDYISKGYARKMTTAEASMKSVRTWYLPHLAVVNPNKPGKIRVCFDASAKVKGVSLNNSLLKGPDIFNAIFGILLKFRRGKVAFTSDIKEMYPQVKITKADQDAQRFLWRGMNREIPPQTYVMESMLFGAICSPYSAQAVKNKNAEEFRAIYPEAVDAIVHKYYMDDYLDSTETVDEAIKLVKAVQYIQGKAGFVLHGWMSNSSQVLDTIQQEVRNRESKDMYELISPKYGRVLGLFWDSERDIFNFKIRLDGIVKLADSSTGKPTKRDALRITMAMFDPLGLIAHVTIQAKIILQKVWKHGISWDEQIPDSLVNAWQSWLLALKYLSNWEVPRCYSKIKNVRYMELHTVCDASENAYAAVCYLRSVGDRNIEISMVASKARVAPVKPMSVPRLELQAAVTGAKLAEIVRNHLKIDRDKCIFWTDSKAVLCWIRTGASKFKVFVSHRVAEIEELTTQENWKWIPSEHNTADLATKPFKLDHAVHNRWNAGPSFLKLGESHWPQPTNERDVENLDDRLEYRCLFVSQTRLVDSLPNISRFSRWVRLIRTTAWMFRFITKSRKLEGETGNLVSELTVKELGRAEIVWWKVVQQECFGEDVFNLQANKILGKSSRLFPLSAYLDDDGVARMRSRLDNATELPLALKHPVILDGCHRYTQLLIMYHHLRACHQGQEYVVNELRQQFYIPHIRQAVRRAWSACLTCRIRRAKPQCPEMASLPRQRLTNNLRPFTFTGIDFFGPLEITVRRSKEKRYGVIFTCLSTRAIHLELADSLSTDSTILAVRRLMARRGCPKEIWTDNATNFHGADRELKRAWAELDKDRLIAGFADKGLDWKFIPPAAPHFGGCWERLIRSVKVALQAILLEKAPRFEVLATLFAEAENIVNSRPLTHVPIDSADSESLTPNHFLIGSSSALQRIGQVSQDNVDLRRQWRVAQRLTDHFWMRWVREYLPSLTRRTKWHVRTKPVSVGDLVIIVDRLGPRNHWPRGIITATYPSKDGQVRVVEVRTSGGTFKRAVSNLAVLDVSE